MQFLWAISHSLGTHIEAFQVNEEIHDIDDEAMYDEGEQPSTAAAAADDDGMSRQLLSFSCLYINVRKVH